MSEHKALPQSHLGYRWMRYAHGLADDAHLSYVLGRRMNDNDPGTEYVVWLFNHEFGGFGNGFYTNDYSAAVADFCTRTSPRRFCASLTAVRA